MSVLRRSIIWTTPLDEFIIIVNESRTITECLKKLGLVNKGRNNKTFLELFEKTNNRREELIKLGYNYVEIWENDWKNFIKIVIKIQKIWKSYH